MKPALHKEKPASGGFLVYGVVEAGGLDGTSAV
jgi:hypothetical protein